MDHRVNARHYFFCQESPLPHWSLQPCRTGWSPGHVFDPCRAAFIPGTCMPVHLPGLVLLLLTPNHCVPPGRVLQGGRVRRHIHENFWKFKISQEHWSLRRSCWGQHVYRCICRLLSWACICQRQAGPEVCELEPGNIGSKQNSGFFLLCLDSELLWEVSLGNLFNRPDCQLWHLKYCHFSNSKSKAMNIID